MRSGGAPGWWEAMRPVALLGKHTHQQHTRTHTQATHSPDTFTWGMRSGGAPGWWKAVNWKPVAPWNSVDTNASNAYLHTDVHTQALQRNTYTQMCTHAHTHSHTSSMELSGHQRFKGIPTHRCAHTSASKEYLHTDVHTWGFYRHTYTQMCTHEVFKGIPTHRCTHTSASKAKLRTDTHTHTSISARGIHGLGTWVLSHALHMLRKSCSDKIHTGTKVWLKMLCGK